jgi:peptide/nickel transport system permease protein
MPFGRLLAARLGEALLVCVAVSLVAFALVHWTGDVAVSIGGMQATPAEVDAIRRYYGFDQPLIVQYFGWAGHVLRGDLGTSFFSHEKVLGMILRRLPVTLALGVASLVLALLAGVPLGVVAAARAGRWPDRLCGLLATLGQSMPAYWSALLLILLFGAKLQWLPISGTEGWRSFVLPSLALAWFVMPVLAQLTRTGMLDVLRQDYIRTAHAKGLAARRVLLRHALRNAMLPVLSVAIVQLGVLLGGSIVVESVFALDGVGLLAWNAIQQSDFPVVQGVVLVVAALFVGLTVLADVLAGLLDPRLRAG